MNLLHLTALLAFVVQSAQSAVIIKTSGKPNFKPTFSPTVGTADMTIVCNALVSWKLYDNINNCFNNVAADYLDQIVFDNEQRVNTIKLEYLNIDGAIPIEFSQLKSLQNLLLGGNNLVGTIPTQLGQITSLKYLLLDNNQLSGDIPSELGQLKSLLYLSIYSNKLSGSIPMELGELTALETLALSSNRLSGTIPSQFGNLVKLNYLDYSNNPALKGTVPVSLCDINQIIIITSAGVECPASCGPKCYQSDEQYPTILPSMEPTTIPTSSTMKPITAKPSIVPSSKPVTVKPSAKPTRLPTNGPTFLPTTTKPTVIPTTSTPTSRPSLSFKTLQANAQKLIPTGTPTETPTLGPKCTSIRLSAPLIGEILGSLCSSTQSNYIDSFYQYGSSNVNMKKPDNAISGFTVDSLFDSNTLLFSPFNNHQGGINLYPRATAMKALGANVDVLYLYYDATAKAHAIDVYKAGKKSVTLRGAQITSWSYPTMVPTSVPTFEPTYTPSAVPTFEPSAGPTFVPSAVPTFTPSAEPTYTPSTVPTFEPSVEPTYVPSFTPTFVPSVVPTVTPSVTPSKVPTMTPTTKPSNTPSYSPTMSTLYPTFETTKARATCTIIELNVPEFIELSYLTFCFENTRSNYVNSVFIYDNPTVNIKLPDDSISGYNLDSLFDPSTYLLSSGEEGGINLNAHDLNSPFGDILSLYYDMNTNSHAMDIYVGNDLYLTINNVQISAWTCKA